MDALAAVDAAGGCGVICPTCLRPLDHVPSAAGSPFANNAGAAAPLIVGTMLFDTAGAAVVQWPSPYMFVFTGAAA